MNDIVNFFAPMVLVIAILLALSFPLRALTCLFSARSRQAVRRRWLAHGVWGGFSLGFLGFMAASAVQAPGQYSARARIAEGFSVALTARVGISEHWQRVHTLPDSNEEAGIAPPRELTSSFLESVTVKEGGAIVMRYRDTPALPEAARGRALVLVPQSNADGLTWVCTGGDMPKRYRPAQCRDS